MVMAAGGRKGGGGGATTTVGRVFQGFATAAAAAARAKVCHGGCRSAAAVAGVLFGVDRSRNLGEGMGERL